MIAPKSNGKARHRRQEQQHCHLSYAPTALAGTQSRKWEKEAGVTSLAGLPGARRMQDARENSLKSWWAESQNKNGKGQ